MLGAIHADDFLRRANGFGQAHGNRVSSRTDLDKAERQTGIYGSEDADSRSDSNAAAHPAASAYADTRDRGARTHRPAPWTELIRKRSLVQVQAGPPSKDQAQGLATRASVFRSRSRLDQARALAAGCGRCHWHELPGRCGRQLGCSVDLKECGEALAIT
jgi:hypothetical protein